MDQLGTQRVDRIRLAGAFGAHIDVKYAMVLGMIPDCDLDNVSAAGNAAGTGALMALLSRGARNEIEKRARGVVKIETAVEPSFQQHFVDAMSFPHGSDEFPELGRRVDLPERSVGSSKPGRRRRRARPKPR
jgi:uncharacterized 2Fe-2S/4Fe-4S cluster protein (DUF4445 family)